MSSLRSSVRPKSSKQAWGTILHPEFGMGYQKMTSYEVEQTVSRLYISPDRPERYYERVQQAELSGEGIKGMVGPQSWLMHTSIFFTGGGGGICDEDFNIFKECVKICTSEL